MSEPAFGDLIRRGREKARISQARLAELIGRSPSTIRSWEHGRTRPSDRSYLKALAAVLGLAEQELVEAAGLEVVEVEPPPRPTVEEELRTLAPERTVMIPVPPSVPKVEPEVAAISSSETVVTETDLVAPAVTNGSSPRVRKVTAVAPPAPYVVRPTSYIEDQEEKEFYWRRWALTAVSVLFMVVVFIWALREAGGAVGELITDFFDSFNI
ncbi:MAG TPA: helix-turn-helix transcriptional regulator [Acidimicrobiia bacterium]|nr:helix-turn-helix transcriptional regulator [Acidimicrobiia bacterium]